MIMNWKQLRLVLVIAVCSFALIACQGSRARISVGKAEETLAEIVDFNGEVHASQDVDRLRELISDTNQRLSEGANSEALDLANQARELADETLQNVLREEARASWDEAQQQIQIGNRNNLRSREPSIAANNDELLSQGQALRAEADPDYREIIRVSREVIQNVNTGISSVRLEAERAKVSASNKLRELKNENASRYDPLSLVNVQDTIENGDQEFNERNDYISARTQYNEAYNQAEIGLTNVQRAKGEENIAIIEELVAIAFEEGAREFLPDRYNQITEEFKQMIVAFNDGRYKLVNNSADQLRPRAEVLKVDTKREAADDRITKMRQRIDDLIEAGVNQYLPGRTQPLEDIFSQAQDIRQQNTEPAFDQIRDLFEDFDDQEQRVVTAFRTLTEEAIADAKESLSKTATVYSTAENIFDQNNENVPADMQPFIERKQMLRRTLGTEIDQTRDRIRDAESRMDQNQFRTSIELAREQERNSEDILNRIYEVVSGNAVIELSNLISLYEREGARVYAPSELERSRSDLNAVKAARDREDYIEASTIAAQSRANIELMAQRISGRAVEDIAEARSLFEDVNDARTEKYSADLLRQVKELLNQAEAELQQEKLKIALELADQANALSRQALEQANRMSAEDAIENASTKINRANSAEASLYAGRLMEQARQLFGQANQLQSNANYVEAENLANSASVRAEQALYKRINDAETAIADAKAVGGWEYKNSDLSQASSNARIAREMLEQGLYDESAELARKAESKAESVASSTRRNNYHEAVNRIQDNLNVGTAQGINYFQFGDSVEVRRELSAIQDDWKLDDYDLIMARLNNLERRLRGTLDTTDDVVTAVADQQQARLNQLVNFGANDFAGDLVVNANNNLKFARIDYENGLYKSAHSNLDDAIQTIDTIDLRYQQESYSDSVENIFSRYEQAQYKFRNILSLEPSEVKALAFGSYSRGNLVAIAGQSTPADFREDVEELYAETVSLSPPPNLVQTHESVVRAINEGRIASIRFEKFLILNEASVDEASRLIDTAYADINRSNQIVRDLRREFFDNEVEFRLVTYEDLVRGN